MILRLYGGSGRWYALDKTLLLIFEGYLYSHCRGRHWVSGDIWILKCGCDLSGDYIAAAVCSSLKTEKSNCSSSSKHCFQCDVFIVLRLGSIEGLCQQWFKKKKKKLQHFMLNNDLATLTSKTKHLGPDLLKVSTSARELRPCGQNNACM